MASGRYTAMFLLAGSLAASAQEPDSARHRLLQLEQERSAQEGRRQAAAMQAQRSAADAARLADQRVAAAAKQMAADQAVADALGRLAVLRSRQDEAQRNLQARAASLAPLLPLIERLSAYPAETVLAVPAPAEQALRGLAILQTVSTNIAQQAAALRESQAALQRRQAEIAASLPALQAAQSAQAAAAKAVNAQLALAQARHSASENEAERAARSIASAAGQAQDLRAAIARLQAEGTRQQHHAAKVPHGEGALPVPVTSRQPFHDVLLRPVSGNVVRRWGDPTPAGPAQGISYQAPPSARVVAACGGRVVFAGPFRSYGQLAILECGGNNRVVLAGLGRLDVHAGQAVRPGEPIGVMPGPGDGRNAVLYMELRQGDDVIDPSAFLK